MPDCQACKSALFPAACVCPCCEQPVCDSSGSPRPQKDGYNRYGISRLIPSEVKRQVRAECFYGCVSCGNMLIQYDHFSPEFASLKVPHQAEGIALLCPTCHEQKKGDHPPLTNEMIAEYRLEPYGKDIGPTHFPNIFFRPGPEIFRVGDFEITGKKLTINASGKRLLEIVQPDDQRTPVSVTAQIYGPGGKRLLELENNTLIAARNSDIEVKQAKRFIELHHNGQLLLHLDRSDAKVMRILYLESWHSSHRVIINDIGIFVDGKLKVGGGDCYIEVNGEIRMDVVRMPYMVGSKSVHLT